MEWGFKRMGNFTSQDSGDSGSAAGALVDGKDGAVALAKGVVSETNAVATIATDAPKKKICCACPETKKLRDECVVEHGQDACGKWIDAHLQCLRSEGFKV